MKVSKFAIILAASIFSTIASSQTLPPPSYAGQSYWFGPGPSAFSVSSSGQTDGGYSEMYMSGGNWVAGVNGGPAFSSVSAGGASITSTFAVNTTVTVQPYIYVDGYFGLQSNVSGFGGVVNLNVGSSRFYIIHNVDIHLGGSNFTNLGLGGVGNSPSLATTYQFNLSDYANPSNYSISVYVVGGTSDTLNQGYSVSTDEGILQVDVARLVVFPDGAAAGNYVGTGTLTVSSN